MKTNANSLKSSAALVLAAGALAVSLTGVGASGAAPTPGFMDRCVSQVQIVKHTQVTINGHTMRVWVNAGDSPRLMAKPGNQVVPLINASCFGIHREHTTNIPTTR